MKILLIGSGGREHALAYGLVKDTSCEKLFVAPGNPGIASLYPNNPVELVDLNPSNQAAIVEFAKAQKIDLVVIGPEKPLVDGLADALRAQSIPVFGPSSTAAQIEGSKDFAKQIMKQAGVITAESFTCTNVSEIDAALDYFAQDNLPFVVKDDGLAAGKGVVVTLDRAEAKAHALECKQVVIEKYLAGPEFSLFGISDGKKIIGLQPAQDFKRAFDNDEGPNTGGMGAYSPLAWLPSNIVQIVEQTVLQPVIDTLRNNGHEFIGLLYAGLVLTKEGIKVIEFNARFGDPETQVLIPRLKTPLAQLLYAAATEDLSKYAQLDWIEESAVTVVLASENYPAEPIINREITGLTNLANQLVFHAGTKTSNGKVISSGGRVLAATGLGESMEVARENAYQLLGKISLVGGHFRKDIALKKIDPAS